MSILKNLKNLFSNKNKIENNIVDNVFIELARDTSYFVGIKILIITQLNIKITFFGFIQLFN